MVIKPIEFAMIQQQNNIAKSQYNADNRPMTEQQTITQQVQKDINVHSQQVNKKDNADNETGKYDAKDKVIMNIPAKEIHGRKRNLMEKSL